MTYLVIPGIVYEEFIENSGVPIEEEWPTPTVQRVGRGSRYYYKVDAETRSKIVSHLDDLACCATGFDSDDRGRAAARAVRVLLAAE